MDHTPPTGAFQALDHDWDILCRRHRRTGHIARWAYEPALAHLTTLGQTIPPRGVDRTPICAAITRLHLAGDDLAARALLQLLVPGLVLLAARNRSGYPTANDAAWDVITHATLRIADMRTRNITSSAPGYVLRSVQRDLALAAEREARTTSYADMARVGGGSAPSAEDVALSSTLVHDTLTDTARQHDLPTEAADIIWHVLAGYSTYKAARTTGYTVATAYRHRDRIYTALRHAHTETSTEPADAGGA